MCERPILALTLGACLLAAEAQAGVSLTPDPQTPPASPTEAAALIVVGRCVDTTAAWSADGKRIETTAVYDVERWIKGAQPRVRLAVRMLGGTVGEISQVAVGGPAARTGERALLFLAPADSDGFVLVGWRAGKLGVDRTAGGVDVLRRPDADAVWPQVKTDYEQALGRPSLGVPDALPLDAVIRSIEKRLEAGGP